MSELEDISWDTVLTDDVIHELLYIDMDDGGDEDVTNTVTPGHVTNSNAQRTFDIPSHFIDQIDPTKTLTDFGQEKILEFAKEYAKKPDSSSLIRHYPTEALRARQYFSENMSATKAPKLLLDILKKMPVVFTAGEEKSVGGEIGQYESETLEYIAGYTLKKASARFPVTIVRQLCSDKPHAHGSLISVMERKAGSLLYPTEEYVYFVRHVYLKFCREANREPTKIQFNNATKKILHGQYFESFVHKLYDMCVEEASELDIRQLATYVTTLMVRMLSHSFAKKLFQKLHQRVTNGAVPLRSQLAK